MIHYLYGLDLSMTCTGVTVFNLDTYEHILTTSVKPNNKKEYGERLKEITDLFDELIAKYPPSIAIIEKGFTRHNTSTQVVYRVHGICNRWFHNIPQIEYAPTSVKASILGGKAGKELIRKKIEKEYPNVKFKNEDESDSFAVALTYLVKNKKIKWNKQL